MSSWGHSQLIPWREVFGTEGRIGLSSCDLRGRGASVLDFPVTLNNSRFYFSEHELYRDIYWNVSGFDSDHRSSLRNTHQK